jgi:hypothetical protein
MKNPGMPAPAPPQRQGSIRILHSSDGVAVGEVGPVCIVIWREAVIKARFDRQVAGLAEVVKRNPEGTCFICVVEPTATPPDDKLRKASVEMVASHGEKLKCVACVIEGTGFRAAVGRSVLSGMALLFGRRETPLSFFANASAAARWMAQYVKINPLEVAKSVETIRKALAPVQARA